MPDSWNKMNVSAAKAPFTQKTITEMMSVLAGDLGCSYLLILDKTAVDFRDIYVDRLLILREYVERDGNISYKSRLATIEYLVHVAIIFNETLLNSEVYFSQNNIDMHEKIIRRSMTFFEDWKREHSHAMSCCSSADRSEKNKEFLSPITYGAIRQCVSGFFAYARLLLKAGIAYVPALHSNTSSLEAWFSQVRSMNKDSPRNYCTAHATTHAGSAVAALRNNRNKSYISDDVATEDEDSVSAIEASLGRRDSEREVILCKIASGKTATEHANFMGTVIPAWQPFSGLVVATEFNKQKGKQNKLGKMLCELIESFEIIGYMGFAEYLSDEKCTHGDRFKHYCRMSIFTDCQAFFNAFYSLSNDDTIIFNQACQFLFDLLLRLTCHEFEKSKNNMANAFYFMIYSEFLSKPSMVHFWESMLPDNLRIGARQGVLFLSEIITDVFRHMFFEGMSALRRQLVLPPSSNKYNTIMSTSINNNTTDNDSRSAISKEEEDSEVQRFFGWAVKELIDLTKEQVCRQHVAEDECEWKYNKDLLLVKSFRVLHDDVTTDIDYMSNYYPPFYSAYNMGGLCLVPKLYFPLAKKVLRLIRGDQTSEKMKYGDDAAISDLYDRLTRNEELFADFLYCVHVGGCGEYVDEKSKQKMWNYLITKTCHARVGVITRQFAEDTTGRYSSVSITESLRLDLKVKTKGKSIARANDKM